MVLPARGSCDVLRAGGIGLQIGDGALGIGVVAGHGRVLSLEIAEPAVERGGYAADFRCPVIRIYDNICTFCVPLLVIQWNRAAPRPTCDRAAGEHHYTPMADRAALAALGWYCTSAKPVAGTVHTTATSTLAPARMQRRGPRPCSISRPRISAAVAGPATSPAAPQVPVCRVSGVAEPRGPRCSRRSRCSATLPCLYYTGAIMRMLSRRARSRSPPRPRRAGSERSQLSRYS